MPKSTPLDLTSNSTLRFKWTLNWKVCLFGCVFLPLLVSLGFWQLSRAQQKLTLQQNLEAQQALPARALQEYMPHKEKDGILYSPVLATGEFMPQRYWLLENKVFNGKVGFEVIMPFAAHEVGVILVNRGWIAGTGYRDQLPNVKTPSGELQINGWLTIPTYNRFLGSADDKAGSAKQNGKNWPRLILSVDVETLAKALNGLSSNDSELGITTENSGREKNIDIKGAGLKDMALMSEILQLAPESPGAFIANWQPINMSPQKHTGYAVQWFAMAFVLACLTFLANSNIAALIKSKL